MIYLSITGNYFKGVFGTVCVSDANELGNFHFKHNFYPVCLAGNFEQSVSNKHSLNSIWIVLDYMNSLRHAFLTEL